MSQQLSWSREGETLKLSGELDQDLLNPLWDKRHDAMQGVTLIDLTDVTRVDTAGVALLAHLIAVGKKLSIQKELTIYKHNNITTDVLPR